MTGVMAPPSAPAKGLSGLAVRIVSALVLAPLILLVIYLGPPWSDILIVLAAAVLGYEWQRICCGTDLQPAGLVMVATLVGAPVLGAAGFFTVAGWWLATGAMAAAVLARPLGKQSPGLWLALGVAYLGAACLCFQWLRQDPATGRAMLFWLLASVWATDVFAYFAGRAIGGPKLAPSISPNKTWAGLAGGMLAAAVVGLITALLLQDSSVFRFALFGATVALVAQAGDLWASLLKRRFGAKDFGRLIPGHGGLLDRVDGLLAASLFVAAIVWLGRS